LTAAAAAAATLVSLARPRLVHFQGSSAKFRPVDGVDCGLALGIVRHLDESKAPGSTRITVRHDRHALDLTVLPEELLHL